MWNGVYGKNSNPFVVEFHGPGLRDPAGLHAARSRTESAADTTVMANQMRMKLPSLKLTQRSTQGKVRHRTVPRGMTSSSARSPGCADDAEKSSQTSPESPGEAGSVEKSDDGESPMLIIDDFDQDHSGPSLHSIKQKAATAAWEKNRVSMLKTFIECNSMPSNQTCITCANEAKYRCLQCASWAFFCSNCFADAHRSVNIFHVGEVWEVSYHVRANDH